MTQHGFHRLRCLLMAALFGGLLWPAAGMTASAQEPPGGARAFSDDDPPNDEAKKPFKKKAGKKKAPAKKLAKAAKKKTHIRWGKRRNETDAQYDKRYGRVVKLAKFDKEGDVQGGATQLWTYKGPTFIVRTDIGPEFTADAAMYMEMLHREYSAAYAKLLGTPGTAREKIEVIIFKEQATYMKNGGMPGSGGFFAARPRFDDRGEKWPALRYRLVQFTDGVDDFAKWPKGVLKHEAAHMEMRMRTGMKVDPYHGVAVPISVPLWFEEGQATIFEYWDFDKTVDENFKEIPRRGRYVPFIRRIHDTDLWKDFTYVWNIDPASWQGAMTSQQGFLNYSQAWSLAAYMMTGGKEGRQDYQRIFNLAKSVGVNRPATIDGEGLRAWELAFPQAARTEMEKNWNAWVAKNIPKGKKIPDEGWYLRQQGYRPDVADKLEGYSKEEIEQLVSEIAEEEKRRQKKTEVEK